MIDSAWRGVHSHGAHHDRQAPGKPGDIGHSYPVLEALLPFLSRVSSGLWFALTGSLTLPLNGSWVTPTFIQGLHAVVVMMFGIACRPLICLQLVWMLWYWFDTT